MRIPVPSQAEVIIEADFLLIHIKGRAAAGPALQEKRVVVPKGKLDVPFIVRPQIEPPQKPHRDVRVADDPAEIWLQARPGVKILVPEMDPSSDPACRRKFKTSIYAITFRIPKAPRVFELESPVLRLAEEPRPIGQLIIAGEIPVILVAVELISDVEDLEFEVLVPVARPSPGQGERCLNRRLPENAALEAFLLSPGAEIDFRVPPLPGVRIPAADGNIKLVQDQVRLAAEIVVPGALPRRPKVINILGGIVGGEDEFFLDRQIDGQTRSGRDRIIPDRVGGRSIIDVRIIACVRQHKGRLQTERPVLPSRLAPFPPELIPPPGISPHHPAHDSSHSHADRYNLPT